MEISFDTSRLATYSRCHDHPTLSTSPLTTLCGVPRVHGLTFLRSVVNQATGITRGFCFDRESFLVLPQNFSSFLLN